MAKRTRVPARRSRAPRTDRRARQPVRKSACKTVVRKPPLARRYAYTEDLLANGRHRYEHTDEPIVSIAADFGCHKTTFQRMANRAHWVRYSPPPRGLTEAAKLLTQVEALQAQEQLSAPSQPAETAAAPDALPPPSEAADRLYRALLQQIDSVEATVARLKRDPHSASQADHAARTLSTLTATLHKLAPMTGHAPQPGYDDDDFPTDIDAFRDQLARDIEAFLASRADEADAG
jgi:hypothetical protein